MNIKMSDIRLFARFGAFEHGKQLYEDGRVTISRITPLQFEANVLTGAGSFQVRVAQAATALQAECSCKSNYYHHCEHIVAALLAGRAYYSAQRPTAERRDNKSSWQAFLDNLSKASGALRSNHRRSPRQWQIVYQLYLRPTSWTIVPYKVYLKKDGRMGRLLPLNSHDQDLSDAKFSPSDPIAIAYLLQKTRWDYNIRLEGYGYSRNQWDSFTFAGSSGRLFELLQESPLFLSADGDLGKPIRFAERPRRIEFRFEQRGRSCHFLPYLLSDTSEQALTPPFYILSENPIWILLDTLLMRIDNLNQADLLLPFSRGLRELVVPQKELPHFIDGIFKQNCAGDALQLPEPYTVQPVTQFSKKRITLKEKADQLELVLSFFYQDREILYSEEADQICRVADDGALVLKIARDRRQEQAAWQALLDTGLKHRPHNSLLLDEKKVIPWLFHSLPALTAEGFEVYGQEKLKRYKIRTSTPTVRLSVATEIDWFDLNLQVEFDGVPLPLKELKRALSRDEKYVKLADHSIAMLPEELIKKFQFLFHFATMEERSLRLPALQVTLIDLLFEEQMRQSGDQGYRQKLARLKDFTGLREHSLPKTFKGVLRPYQKAGYDWLLFLKEYGFGGCLADDMGLGKTVQALALLLKEKENGCRTPSLIVCPTSVVFNWEKEVQKFAPDLTVLVHTGMQRRRNLDRFAGYDVILTSYGLVLRDLPFLKEHRFHYVILDESQKIKNPLSQTAKAVHLLKAEHRLVLTGTPVENNTSELWSQFSFLNPGLLGSLPTFRSFFALPIEKRNDEEAVTLLKRMIFPFVLRRSKELVEKELPEKSEQIYYCNMNPEQARLYRHWRDFYRSLILHRIDQVGLDRARMNILEGLVKLRQISCHPQLIDRESAAESSKFEALKEMLEDILAEGHKVLIFSQFVKMLAVVRKYLDEQSIAYEYLDGHTIDRKTCVQHFQSDASVRIFLISLKAGGTGLNLTAADYVVLYDPWWNPAVELQATDRAHRIGQDKKVFVYRMITKDTVEEKMLELQERKRSLVANLIGVDSGFFKSLTRHDIEVLFS